MENLRYTLISDGSSDRAFIPILDWLLKDLKCNYFQGKWADFSRDPKHPKSLTDKITRAIELYPCDLLFIHRDAEKEPRENRVREIEKAILQANITTVPVVCLIPIRMLEAWLLFDEVAIRKAAGNPKGKSTIQLPAVNKIENLPNPKDILITQLKQASESKRFKDREARKAIHRLADLISDYSTLDKLSAFQALKQDLSETLNANDWL
ncbi:MAG: hypothetical protein Tsb0014_15300 [Pleurocapsa sp.]